MKSISTPEEKIESLEEQIHYLIQHRERLKNDIDRLESRLQKIGDKLEGIVVTEGEDAGVVLLSTDAPCRYEAGCDVPIYGLAYFSPLGEALMEVYQISRSKGGIGGGEWDVERTQGRLVKVQYDVGCKDADQYCAKLRAAGWKIWSLASDGKRVTEVFYLPYTNTNHGQALPCLPNDEMTSPRPTPSHD